jgi:hypothetical protein
MQQRERAAVADGALDVAADPVVAVLVDKAEPQPHRIAEIDAGDASRIGRAVVDAVGGKRKGALGKSLSTPAAEALRIAAPLRRILGVELSTHKVEGRGRQPGGERGALLAVDDENVVAFLDARRRKPDLAEQADRDRGHRGEPRPGLRCDRARDDEHGRDHQHRIAKEAVDRQPERRDNQDQRGELQPGLVLR